MTALIMAVFVVLLDMIIIVTAIPKITSTFHSLPDVGWYGAAYNLSRSVLALEHVNFRRLYTNDSSSSALQPLAGKFYTYFKTKVHNACTSAPA
jgi:hypothetical protein